MYQISNEYREDWTCQEGDEHLSQVRLCIQYRVLLLHHLSFVHIAKLKHRVKGFHFKKINKNKLYTDNKKKKITGGSFLSQVCSKYYT